MELEIGTSKAVSTHVTWSRPTDFARISPNAHPDFTRLTIRILTQWHGRSAKITIISPFT
jgi:hypothetical protein